jgi:hypothetical protein
MDNAIFLFFISAVRGSVFFFSAVQKLTLPLARCPSLWAK